MSTVLLSSWLNVRREPGAGRAANILLALLAGLLVFAIYVLTLYPGLGDGDGDSAKFAFLGRVLGTAHPPGYPAYVLISHLFSYLPLGTLAYRINLMSACFAALGVVAAYASARALGCGRTAAVAAALGLGFGQTFWAKAELAEVYSLGGCLVAAAVASLLWWRRTGRASLLLGSVALTSLAFGNHLTVVAAIPAFVLYALVSDWRACLRGRVLMAVAVIVALGFAQYGFIILRTLMHAPYLEARATNLRELWDVVTARHYAGAMFQMGWWQILTVRVPEVAGLIWRELGVMSAAWLVVGVVALARRQRRELLLLGVGALGVTCLTLNIDADIEGFLLPVFVMLWPAVGVGLDRARRVAGSRWPRFGPVVIVGCALAIPASQLWTNFARNDHRRATGKSAYYAALFEMLPARAVVVAEDYPTDMAVLYKLLGERAQQDRDIQHSRADPQSLLSFSDRGYSVFAFSGGRALLQRFGFAFEKVPLLGPSLEDYLRGLKPGWIVAIGGTPGTLRSLPIESARLFGHIGATLTSAGPTSGAFGVVGVRGATAGALVVRGTDVVDMAAPSGLRIGETGVTSGASFRLVAAGSGASFTLGDREVVRVDAGLVVAVFRSDGLLVDAASIDPSRNLRVPLNTRQRPVYRATFAARCEAIGNTGWTDVSASATTGRVTMRVDNVRPFDSRLSVYVGTDEPLPPRIVSTGGSGHPRMTSETFRMNVPGDVRALGSRVADDGIRAKNWVGLVEVVSRIEVQVNDGGDFASITLDLGGRPRSVIAQARVDRDDPWRATFCSAPPAR
ncbi:MAG: DUF2723 domain-containing protein [Acidobacteria bacterium]|nr:DUF2723 domain-containing protein [Acidobacteriota bacterium]